MKKLFVLLSAVALIGLTSCSQEQLGPKNEGVKKEVKTSFSFNISTNAATKATAAEVQADGSFLGMSDMTLFVADENINVIPQGQQQAPDFLASYKYDLGSLGSGVITDQQSSKIYNLSIPVGVQDMTFYGRATKGTDNAGEITWTVGTTKANTSFGITPILNSLNDFNTTATALAAILNDVISADGWAALATSTDVMMKPLKDAYNELTTIQTGEFRDGSGFGVLRVLTDLRKVVSKITSPAEAKTVADAIAAKIDTYVDANDKFITTAYADFPSSLGVPNGAAQLTFESGQFKYVTGPQSFGSASVAVTDVSKFSKPVELTYWVNSPIRVTSAEVEDTDYPVTVDSWDAASWTSGGWASGERNGIVSATTRAVALQNNINYGVAALKATVKYGASTVADNRKAILDRKAAAEGGTNPEADMAITVNATSFEVNGILVGGQPAQVGWNWVPAAGTFDNVIYDNTFDSKAIPATGESNPFYTLVFDNLQEGASAQDVVYVALELVNNVKDDSGKGVDFYGRDNLIPAGATFYMVGKLDLSEVKSADITALENSYPVNTDGNGYRFPPLDANGYNDFVPRIFMQDYMTVVNFTINNLHGAYSTVPDLRSVEMTFGLSVDLVWKSGLSFDIALGD